RTLGGSVEPERSWLVAPDFTFAVGPTPARALKEYRGRRIVLLALYSLPGSRPRLAQLAQRYDILVTLGAEVVAVPTDAAPDPITRLGAEPRVFFPVVTGGADEIVAAYRLFARPPPAEPLIRRPGYSRARRHACGRGRRRAGVERRGRGPRGPARDQRAGPHPRRDPGLHARDDHGLPRRLPKNYRLDSSGRRGTIYVTGCAAERDDHRDRERQVRRTGVSKPLAALLLAAGLGAATPAAAATLFITNTKSDSVSVIDTDTLDVVGTIPLGRGKPNRIVFQPDGTTAWVVYDKTHDLGLIDADARKLVRRVKVGGKPDKLRFPPDGSHLV